MKPRFTLRDLFWLVLVVACLCAWRRHYVWWRAGAILPGSVIKGETSVGPLSDELNAVMSQLNSAMTAGGPVNVQGDLDGLFHDQGFQSGTGKKWVVRDEHSQGMVVEECADAGFKVTKPTCGGNQ